MKTLSPLSSLLSSAYCILLVASFSARSAVMVDVKVRPSDENWKSYPAHPLKELPGFPPTGAPPPLSSYGGDASRHEEATGFFRVQKLGARWWLIDPTGAPFFAVAMNSVSVSRTPGSKAAFEQKFGTDAAWAGATTKILRDAGFNTLGNWSSTALLRAVPQPLAYCVKGSFMAEYGKQKKLTSQGSGHVKFKGDCLPVFNADFPAFCDAYAKQLVNDPKDPCLLGYFLDNELPAPQLERYLALDPAEPILGGNYRAAREWLDHRRGTNSPLSAITAEDRDEFMGYAFDRYLSLATAALRKYDPNHLCIGSRFHSVEKKSPATFRAAGRYLDIISINLYGVWEPKPPELERWTEWSGKPIMITEWYAKGMDSGLGNQTGAGWTVKTQQDRALFYETFCLGLLKANNCVGWHWFKYQDNDPQAVGVDPSNRDSNKGVLRIDFTPYEPLLDSMTLLNRNVYRLRP